MTEPRKKAAPRKAPPAKPAKAAAKKAPAAKKAAPPAKAISSGLRAPANKGKVSQTTPTPTEKQVHDFVAKQLMLRVKALGTGVVSPARVKALTTGLLKLDPAVATDLLTALFGGCEPPADWWRTTPAGPFAAAALAKSGKGFAAGGITRPDAGAILGVTTGTVAQLRARDTLKAEPGKMTKGGQWFTVTKASVLARVAAQAGVAVST